MKKTGLLGLAILMTVGASAASAQGRVAGVAKAMPTRYIEPTCDLRAGHFMVQSGVTYLAVGSGGNRNVDGTTDPEKVETALNNAVRVITQAIRENNQGNNPAAWYYLGRAYLQMGDVVGADTAFTRAVSLAPACSEDVKSWRQRAVLPLMAPAAEYADQGKIDSAIVLLKQASSMAPGMPQADYNIGVLYANADQPDSAIKYFTSAQRAAEMNPTSYLNERNSSTFNLAAMYQRADRHNEAVTELRKYLEWVPGDNDARRALATSLRASGQTEAALEVEKQALAAAQASGDLSAGDLMSMGVNQFNAGSFADAAESFKKVLAMDPHNRDAQYNLANAYLSIDGEYGQELIAVSRELIAREPLSEENRKLLAQGFRRINEQDSLIAVVTELIAMPTSVTVDRFAAGEDRAVVGGFGLGRQAERDGAAVPATPRTIVVEFLAKDGSVVSSEEVAIPALDPGVKFEWTANGTGAGIAGWRYRVK
jgi:tetratricopeptide (TPR) repeat protein